MRYHNITHDDMKNGDGLRVVLWVSGCSHRCSECQNPITWNPCDGLKFDTHSKQEIFDELDRDYISGITFSGGDPLHEDNLEDVYHLCEDIKSKYPNKTIWLYTGYTWSHILNDTNEIGWALRKLIVELYVDILVDGRFEKDLLDINYHWAGSTNQNVIYVKQSIKEGKIILWK